MGGAMGKLAGEGGEGEGEGQGARLPGGHLGEAWFMVLLSPWPLALQIPSFAIGRVRVDEIEKEEQGEVKG
jgi:hypothetical protein